jgi:hypothetical protein
MLLYIIYIIIGGVHHIKFKSICCGAPIKIVPTQNVGTFDFAVNETSNAVFRLTDFDDILKDAVALWCTST